MATIMDEVEDINDRFLKFMLSPEDVDKATAGIYEDLVDEVLMGFVFDAHRSAKYGVDEAEDGIEDAAAYNIVDAPGLDVFGEPMTRKTGKCSCPNCEHIVSANRFATHLERCLGMGRNSSRVASRRISNSAKERIICSDDDNDDDWSQSKKRKRNNRKNGKKQKKRTSVSQKEDSDISTSNSPPDFY